jgi:hypothetical protein
VLDRCPNRRGKLSVTARSKISTRGCRYADHFSKSCAWLESYPVDLRLVDRVAFCSYRVTISREPEPLGKRIDKRPSRRLVDGFEISIAVREHEDTVGWSQFEDGRTTITG